MPSRRLFLVAEEIMSRRNEQLADSHIRRSLGIVDKSARA
jgi:hypothetical protein